MTHIPSSEIKQPQLHADTLGFSFVWKGHFLRGIYPQSVDWARGYFESGFIKEITEKELFPKTWISDFENEQFGMIIEHEKISPVLYATDWNSAMLKDAALMVLDIAEIGWKYGFNMVDCHKLNVMFKNNRPIYVDLGSFVPREEGCTGWKPYKGFLESYHYILYMWTHGSSLLAKRMMSPGVYLRTADYKAYKFPLYRQMPKMLRLNIRFRELVNYFSVSGNKKFAKSSVQSLAKWISNILKPGISQHLGFLRSGIERLKVDFAKMEGEVAGFDISFIKKAKSITCVNIGNSTILTKLSGGVQLISINENDSVSNTEYKQLKDITSVSYPLLNGCILIRDKYPEKRLCSEIVIARFLESGHGSFALHNSLIYLEECLSYSTTGEMYVWMPKPDRNVVEMMKEKFLVLGISNDGKLILLNKKVN